MPRRRDLNVTQTADDVVTRSRRLQTHGLKQFVVDQFGAKVLVNLAASEGAAAAKTTSVTTKNEGAKR